MTVLNIKAISVEAPYLEELLCSYLHFLGMDYYKMLFLSWGFSISPVPQSKLGTRVELDKGDFVSLMRKYCGIELSYRSFTDSDGTMDIIRSEIDNRRAVVINCNSMYLPYHRTYGKANEAHPHDVLVTGYTNTDIFILDPGWLEDSIAINIEEFKKAMNGKVGLFRYTGKQAEFCIKEVLQSIIDKTMRDMNGYGNMFDAIHAYADMLEKEFDPEIEFEVKEYTNENLKWEPIFTRLTRIDGQRAVMNQVFDYLYKLSGNLGCKEISEMFLECVKKWAHMRYAMFRAIIKENRVEIKKCTKKLHEIAEYERVIHQRIRQVHSKMDDFVSGHELTISLEEYYNMNFFGEPHKLDSDSYILIDSVPSNIVIQTQGYSFRMPDTSRRFNVVRAEGQIIDVPKSSYRSVGFLGFATFAGYVGDLVIEYDDGSRSKYVIALNDFMEKRPRFGEKVGLNCQICKYDRVRSGLIYFEEIQIKETIPMRKIILPEWSRLFFVAITLKN